jgi:integrase
MKIKSKGRYFLRGRIFWIAYHDGHSKEIRESTKSTDEAKAKQLLEFRLKQVSKAQIDDTPFTVPKARRMTVEQALLEFRTHYELHKLWCEKLHSTWKIVKAEFGPRRVEHITKGVIEAYQLRCKTDGFANATINRRVGLLLRAIKLAELTAPRVKKLPELNARQGFFEVWEVRRVIAHLPEDLGDAILFCFLSAWRRGEVLGLTWSDLMGDVIMLPADRSKNRQPRQLPLTGELSELIDRRRKLANGPLIFHLTDSPNRVGDFRKAWKTACKLAGVPGRLVHDLRRSSIRDAVRGGTPERIVMQKSGHKTRAVFDRYNIVSEADLRNEQERTETYRRALEEKQMQSGSTSVQ